MVLLLNYLPWIIAILGVFVVYKLAVRPPSPKRNRNIAFTVAGFIAALVLLQGLTAGYIPKMRSSETKIPAPAFEATEAQVQDRLRSPKRLGEDSEKRFNEKTDWRQHNRDEAARAKAVEPEVK